MNHAPAQAAVLVASTGRIAPTGFELTKGTDGNLSRTSQNNAQFAEKKGNRMIYVNVRLNSDVLISLAAKRIHPLIEEGERIPADAICTYQLSNGQRIQHVYGDGPFTLARKMIEAVNCIHEWNACAHNVQRCKLCGDPKVKL